jgi:hypothetical protein
VDDGSSSEQQPRNQEWSGTEWRKTGADSGAAADEHEKRLAMVRRGGLVALAAIVLLPPYAVGLLVLGLGGVYICIVVMRSICMRNWGVPHRLVPG